jgi:rhamnosyltransferase
MAMASLQDQVLAVVVTHHPDAGLAGRLRALRAEVGAVLVVNNGSEDFAAIEAAARAADCRVIGNPVNLGVAAALNQGVEAMLAGDFAWLAMFDQDSLVPEGAIAALLDLYDRHPAREAIAVLAMSHRDRATGADYHRGGDILEETGGSRSVRTTITSGSLARREALESLGAFDEGLFIDGVDHDFCLRCRGAGRLVIEARAPVLEHSLGAIVRRRFLGRDVPLSNHSATRRYYITRNSLELSVRHFGRDPRWSIRELVHLATSSAVVALLEDDRRAKARAMVQGAWHFATRRFGPRLPETRTMGSGGTA